MSVPYVAGDGSIRQRKNSSGNGTSDDPDIFSFSDQGTYDRLGTASDSPITTPTATGTLGAVIRGLWQNMLGAASDASSSTGSIHAKLRNFADVIGTAADALSTTGSVMARLRTLSEGLGTASDASSNTGSIHAKLRSLIANTVGAIGDASLSSGSLMAMVRFLAESNFAESQTSSAVTVDTSLTTVITFDCRGKSTLGVQLQNTGTVALSALQVQARFNSSSGTYYTIASTNADFTTSNGKQSNNGSAEIINSGVSSGTIVALSASTTAWFRMRCDGMDSVRIQAQVAATSTTMLAYGIAEK
ncbi:hypothetical protein G7B40_040190 [Aetokthonos hydrillicola Thurmond2011]|jgi:hypothetical protein|uniref:Uncharacterized protein n=1 Tax=Aetokthonos hydrillicola Thurmond2011 TaxID=2712845 RepID=A0AAP5MCV8_9CYAN|nr:hypothetical protein [Aetokthonos hydrillicola]MBO3459949.1 hypothetical protein [Aetokthonos hydrillicola CCALA 1050]MBW4584068.1 hypothetical protein [Aetokthonos hydrillicola CCALA 1050]MDR9900710.1 hypothetical protein [Aetokthonos hydrillicola Thurmond2011]